MTAPTGRDLNVGLARLIGYSVKGEWWYDGHKQEAPPFSHSLDALFAPGGPVEYATSKGWRISIYTDEFSKRVLVWRGGYGKDSTRANVVSTTTAEALATALHEAFMKEQGQ